MNRQRLIPLGFILAGLLVYVSCRKIDRQTDEPSKSTTESKFFTNHSSSIPLVQAINRFVKGENSKYYFVDKLVKQIGFPYWDKAIVTSGNKRIGGRGASDSTITTFIPFALDSQNVVNASLVINTSPSDTTFHFLCDWQYADRINGSPAVDTTAENLAVLFMLLDNNVFGHTRFTIADSSLFINLPKPPGSTGREIVINNPSNVGGRHSRTELQTIMVCFYGYVCGTPTWCGNHGGCDYNNPCPTGQCYATATCFDFEVEEGTGGGTGSGSGTGSGTGTGGSGTGGGSSGGPWTPPPCPGAVAVRCATYVNCTPGWNPTGVIVINPPPPLNDSTIAENLKRLIQKANNKPDSVHTAAQQDGNERTFSFLRTRGDTTVMYIKPGTSHTSSPTLTPNTFAILHTHQEDDLTAIFYKNECFDGPDIYKLYKNVTIDGYQIEASILTTRDYYYAAVITDPIKFRDYIRTICGSQNLGIISDMLDSLHAAAMSSCIVQPMCNYQKQTELGALAITANNNSSISGIKIFRSPKQNIQFTLLTP